jgi:hypothetical protein
VDIIIPKCGKVGVVMLKLGNVEIIIRKCGKVGVVMLKPGNVEDAEYCPGGGCATL